MKSFIEWVLYRTLKRKSINKGLKIMTTLIMLTFSFNSLANKNLYSQTEITINLKNTTIIGVLDYIESNTELRFIFDSDIYNFNKKVSISIRDKNLDQTLFALFGSKVIFQLKENLVFLKEVVDVVKLDKLNIDTEDDLDELQSPITGKIVDGNSVPLPGVNVFIKGSSVGTASDFDGNYSIPATSGDVLIFSFVGFENQEVIISDQQNIDISMVADYANLDEVVITGYGSTAKKDLVSSISQIKGDVLANQPVARVDNMLQGRAAGVNVVSSSGEPGAPAVIRIRGMSSINGNNNPLFVIDGFIAGTDFNLSNLNVNDVESIEVLKDASSLAIYGTRGAAGVILINTKSGKSVQEGKIDVSINHYSSIQQVYNYPEMADIGTWAEYWNEGVTLVPGPDGFGFNDPALADMATHAPNWQSITPTDWSGLITRNGRIDNTDVNISGNSKRSNYFISYNRFYQEGIILGSGLERNSLRANIDLNITDKIRTGIRMNVTDRKQENNKVNWQGVYFNALPIMSVYNEDGSYNALNPVRGSYMRNPVADINERIDHNFVTNVIANAYVEADLLPDLTIRSSVGSNLNFNKANDYIGTIDPVRAQQGIGGKADVAFSRSTGFLNENTLTYSKDFGEHSIKVLAGYTMQKDTYTDVNAGGAGYANDVVTFNSLSLGADALRNIIGSDYRQRTFESILGRINYSFRDKYLLTLVGRRDGSSVFEQGNKYAFFPSIGAAWKIGEEDFIQDIDMISSLKLRGSYGIVGEQGVQAYNSLAKYTPRNVFFNQSISPAVILASLPSTGLDWEKTYQTDIGLEIGFLNNRYSVEIDYYNKQTKDLLLAKPLPGTAGDTRLENIGQVENKGFEFTLNSVNIEKPDFVWSSNLQISANRNKVISIGDAPFIDLRNPNHGQAGAAALRLVAGEVMPSFYGATYEGTYKSADEIIADGREGVDLIGAPNYIDQNGDGNINDLDFVNQGSPQPDFYYGFRNTLTYKNFTLDVFFQGMQGNEVFDASIYEFYYGRDASFNLLPLVKDRWTPDNPTSDIPRAGTSAGGYRPNSSLNVVDGSYLRLKNVTLNYDFDTVPGLSFIESASVYLTGNNLLLLTNYKWGDPEVSDGGANTVAQGVADDQYPYASSVALGFRLNL
jgi:TonB-linked SusC/RagA family outer membrane protein